MLGHRSPGLALQPGNQPGHVLPNPSPLLRPTKPTRNPRMQRIQLAHNEISYHTDMIHYRSSKVPLRY